MKIFIIGLLVVFCNAVIANRAFTQISQDKFSCLFMDSANKETDKGFYLQISPENLNMVERNSKLREKNHGYADIVAFNTWNGEEVTAELLYTFDIEVIQHRYYKNRGLVKFPHVFFMDKKTYKLNIENTYTKETLNYRCKQLSNNLSFEVLIEERITELQELIDLQ